jgi:hypothetical protein
MSPRRNVMTLLEQARPACLDPEPDPLRRERDLARILTSAPVGQDRSMTPGRRIAGMPARRFSFGLGITAAAATVVTVIVSSTGTPNLSRSTAEPAAPASTRTTSTATATLGSRQILLLAADKAAHAAPAGGRYWAAKSTFEALYQVNQAGATYDIRMRQRDDTWTARSATATSWYIAQNLGAGPATAADKAAWVKAGSPTSFQVKDIHTLTISATAGKVSGNPSNSGSSVFSLGGRNVSMKDLQALPGDPAKLKALLLRYFHDGGAGGELPSTSNAWLFEVGASMLSMPITPAVRAATYRIVAALPGVRSLGSTTDIDGRTGNGVAIQTTDPYGVDEIRVIIDPDTGLPLAQEYVYLKSKGVRSWLTPNDVWYAQVFHSLGWTNDSPPKVSTN